MNGYPHRSMNNNKTKNLNDANIEDEKNLYFKNDLCKPQLHGFGISGSIMSLSICRMRFLISWVVSPWGMVDIKDSINLKTKSILIYTYVLHIIAKHYVENRKWFNFWSFSGNRCFRCTEIKVTCTPMYISWHQTNCKDTETEIGLRW